MEAATIDVEAFVPTPLAQWLAYCSRPSGAREQAYSLDRLTDFAGRNEGIRRFHHGLLRTAHRKPEWARRQRLSCWIADRALAKRGQKPRTRVDAWLHPLFPEFEHVLLHVASSLTAGRE